MAPQKDEFETFRPGGMDSTGNQGPAIQSRISDAAEKAKEAASSTADKAKDMAHSVVDKAKGTASAIADKAQDATRRAGDIAKNVGQKAEETVASVGGQMKSLAGTIREKAPHEGAVGSAACTVAGTLESGGEYLQEHNLHGMAQDMTSLIRRYPLQSLLVGIGIGFLISRATRS
jgi:vacuolar-type H+-ATPase subunit H